MVTRRPITLKELIFGSSLNVTRLYLSMGAFLTAIFLLWPGSTFPTDIEIQSGSLYHHEFKYMALWAREELWGIAFFIQSVWGYYTLRTGVKNCVTLVLDGILGCLLWTSSTILVMASYWPEGAFSLNQILSFSPPATVAPEVIMCTMSYWHLIRYWIEDTTTH